MGRTVVFYALARSATRLPTVAHLSTENNKLKTTNRKLYVIFLAL